MAGKTLRRLNRQRELLKKLEANPFLTDRELAVALGVSIQTVRLDRLSLRIPEARERLKWVAQKPQQWKNLWETGQVGELIALEEGKEGISFLEIGPEMVAGPGRLGTECYLFAQANSLAHAVVGKSFLLTDSARIRYWRPVFPTEKVVAKAVIKVCRGESFLVSVRSHVKGETVFKGHFILFAQEKQEKARGEALRAYCR